MSPPSASILCATLLALAALPACSGPAPRPRPRALPHEPLSLGPRDALGRRLERLVAAVTTRGGRLAGRPQRTFLTEGGHVVRQVPLSAGCHLLAALGASAVGDLDLSVHDVGGMLVREDVERDAAPSVRFCPPRPTTTYAVLVGQSGGGEVVLVDLLVPGELDVDVAALLGEPGGPEGPSLVPSPAAPRAPPLPGPPDSSVSADQALAAAAGQLEPLGYQRAGLDLAGSLLQGRAEVRDLELSAGTCYAVVAAGDAGVRDLDLRLVDRAGAEISRDTATDPRALLRVCPAASGTFRLEVRMFDGAGRWAARALALASLAEAPGSLPAPLRQRWAEVAARLRARGFSPLLPLERGDLHLAGRQVHHERLRAGQCYALVAVAAEGDLDLAVLDPDRGVVASDTGDDATPIVWTCPRSTRTLALEVKLYRAQTEYVLGVWTSPGEAE